MLQNILSRSGLSPDQAEIYISLLDHGPQTATRLSSTTKVKRTYIYKLCSELGALGLVASTGDKKTIFKPLSPDILVAQTQEKIAQSQQGLLQLETIVPFLKEKYSQIDTKPVITFYEGLRGVKQVYEDALSANGLIEALVETSELEPELYSWLTTVYAPKRVAKNIRVKAIVATGSRSKTLESKNTSELRETIFVDSKRYPIKNEINIYNNKLTIINHQKGQPLLGIIIDNPLISQTMHHWFRLVWDSQIQP